MRSDIGGPHGGRRPGSPVLDVVKVVTVRKSSRCDEGSHTRLLRVGDAEQIVAVAFRRPGPATTSRTGAVGMKLTPKPMRTS